MNESFTKSNTKSNSEFEHSTLEHATLEEAVRRVVIGLKDRNGFVYGIRESPFLNYKDELNPDGVLPDPDDLLRINMFSSREHALTLLAEENRRNGCGSASAHYTTRDGVKKRYFSDTLGQELCGKIVYVVTTPSTTWSPEEIVFRMQVATQTARDMGAKCVYAVFSEFPYARQDRGVNKNNRMDEHGSIEKDRIKHAGQTDYISIIMKSLIVNGCDGIVTLHHHSGEVERTARTVCNELNRENAIPFIYNISPSFLIARYLTKTDIFGAEHIENKGEGIVFISPDKGALNFVAEIKQLTGYDNAGFACIEKIRGQPNAPDAMTANLIPQDGSDGNYDGKVGFIPDDMVDTFGTMNNAISALSTGIERFILYSTHGIYAQGAEDRLRKQSRISDVLVMDTRPSRLRDLGPGTKRKVTIIKPASYVAFALSSIERGEDPNKVFAELYQRDPCNFDAFYNIKRFDQHYRHQKK